MTIECLTVFENNPEGVYYAGQELSGSVDIIINAPKKIRSIYITVKGFAKIRWMKKGYYNQNTERATCRAYRSYLNSRSYVLGTSSNVGCIELQAGQYTYSFNVILPPNIPTSFDGIYGQIHYEIVTSIDRPNRCLKQYRLPFTVIQLINLNDNPIYSVPLEICSQERYWSFCCPIGAVSLKFSTPYNGYAPGQRVFFTLFVDNESGMDVISSTVSFCQEVEYESREPQHEYRYDKHKIITRTFGNVLRWSRKMYRGTFYLPSIPPTCTIEECPIKIQYSIKVCLIPNKFHKKFKIKIPLTVGTVPILENSSRNHPPQLISRTIEDEQNQLNESNDDNPPDYIPMILPSYQDAIALTQKFIDDNLSVTCEEINTSRTLAFVPRYPVYTLQNDDVSITESQTEQNF